MQTKRARRSAERQGIIYSPYLSAVTEDTLTGDNGKTASVKKCYPINLPYQELQEGDNGDGLPGRKGVEILERNMGR